MYVSETIVFSAKETLAELSNNGKHTNISIYTATQTLTRSDEMLTDRAATSLEMSLKIRTIKPQMARCENMKHRRKDVDSVCGDLTYYCISRKEDSTAMQTWHCKMDERLTEDLRMDSF